MCCALWLLKKRWMEQEVADALMSDDVIRGFRSRLRRSSNTRQHELLTEVVTFAGIRWRLVELSEMRGIKKEHSIYMNYYAVLCFNTKNDQKGEVEHFHNSVKY